MKGKRYSIEQKVRILHKADEGSQSIGEICGAENISEVTFYRRKKELWMLSMDQAKALKELQKENARLKRIVADQLLGMEVLQEALGKKW